MSNLIGIIQGLDQLADFLNYTTDKDLNNLCTNADIKGYALDPTYCPGADDAARLSNARTGKNLDYFKNYDSRVLEVDITEFLLNHTGASDSVVVECINRYTDSDYTCYFTITQGSDWLNIQASATGNETVTITADDNNTGSSREGKIEVSISGYRTIELTLTQNAAPCNPELTGVNTIVDGTEYDRMNVSVTYTNPGSAGNATVDWEIRDSSNSLVDSGSQLRAFANGSSSTALSGITYPTAGSNYTLRAKMSDESTWEVSNQFDVS